MEPPKERLFVLLMPIYKLILAATLPLFDAWPICCSARDGTRHDNSQLLEKINTWWQ